MTSANNLSELGNNHHHTRLQGDASGGEPASNAGDIRDTDLIPGSGRSPEEGHGNPLVFLSRKYHEQRSLVGYSPRGSKESDRTKQQHPHIQDSR